MAGTSRIKVYVTLKLNDFYPRKHLYKSPTQIAIFVLAVLILCSSCEEQLKPGSEEHIRAVTGAIDDKRLIAADDEPGNWLSHGRTYAEERYSPLDQITTENVNQLGLVWSSALGTRRGIEASPLVVDGIMYFSGPWSVVFAFDVRTAELLWRWDPEVPREYAVIACCDVVNRGVALYKGKIFVGVLDGRLAALDAATGALIWEKVTVDQTKNYSITGAPRVVKGQVIIGNGGAEKGVRGYVSAYDAEDGRLTWRFYIVPGDPSKPFESRAMETAAKTWNGEWWKFGGGGTAWDAIVYDQESNLLYVGTGNGSPWSRFHRSQGEGDNLYLSSILALNPDNGELVWYYQTTPGDNWDYTATQPLILTDIEIKGKLRKVIMQAPKNGFFYVLDRETGELLSAEPFTEQTWTTGVDMKTGRPIEIEGSDFKDAPFEVAPSPLGGHNWHPMAYSPITGLVYIPALESKMKFTYVEDWTFTPVRGRSIGGQKVEGVDPATGHLLAWDPIQQKEAWRVSHISHWNGGTLVTAGNVVFQGTGEARFVAYDAKTGKALWEAFLGTGVIAPPITYLVDGIQYITIVAGWGGIGGLHHGLPYGEAAKYDQIGRVFTFAVGGQEPMPVYGTVPPVRAPNYEVSVTKEQLTTGASLYSEHCQKCHGRNVVSGMGVPDLRRASDEVHTTFEPILLGARINLGMPSFQGILSNEEIKYIQAYVISEAEKAAQNQKENDG